MGEEQQCWSERGREGAHNLIDEPVLQVFPEESEGLHSFIDVNTAALLQRPRDGPAATTPVTIVATTNSSLLEEGSIDTAQGVEEVGEGLHCGVAGVLALHQVTQAHELQDLLGQFVVEVEWHAPSNGGGEGGGGEVLNHCC